MKNQKFGVEIELTGVTRENAAKLMAELTVPIKRQTKRAESGRR